MSKVSKKNKKKDYSKQGREAFGHNPLSRWHPLPPVAARLTMPPAALPGANLLPDQKEWGYQTGLKKMGQSKT